MKITRYIIGAAAALAITSCDSVDEADRYIELPGIDAKKAVLVLDFTGQSCTNCPVVHEHIEALQEQYGPSFIPVSIHAGTQSLPISQWNTRYGGLATPTGEEYDAYFGIAPLGYPSVVIDDSRSLVFGGAANNLSWIDAVRTAMQDEALVDITCDATHINTPDGKSQISISTTLTAGQPLKGKLQLWILEDSIVMSQSGVNGNPKPTLRYTHNNVLRAAANGTWGEDISLEYGQPFTPEPTTYTITGEWEESWNIDNLSIVAFFYNDSDGALQATRVKVNPAPKEP